jgi:hypothetical protein
MDNEPTQQTPDNPRTPEPPVQPGQNNNQPGGYKKRPIWQWVVLYVIIAAIVYALIYMLFMGNDSAGY